MEELKNETTTAGNSDLDSEFTTTDGNTLYIFYSQPLTYQNNVMEVYTVIDSNGTIVKNEIGTFLYGHGVDYLPIYTQGYGNTSSETFINYENKYVGITEDTMSDDLLVTGATTGAERITIQGLRANGVPADIAEKGMDATFAVPVRLRENDKVYRIVQK